VNGEYSICIAITLNWCGTTSYVLLTSMFLKMIMFFSHDLTTSNLHVTDFSHHTTSFLWYVVTVVQELHRICNGTQTSWHERKSSCGYMWSWYPQTTSPLEYIWIILWNRCVTWYYWRWSHPDLITDVVPDVHELHLCEIVVILLEMSDIHHVITLLPLCSHLSSSHFTPHLM